MNPCGGGSSQWLNLRWLFVVVRIEPPPLPTPASWGEGEDLELWMVLGFKARIVRSGNS
ncbi:MAG: hypothetical protein JWQ04_1752, partial [Pedosphaera sp.]|nr:hypothetical protein [Pedosphaera sp.]